jgi:electron-transferring-flavoprotein dehydrogenase
MGATSAFHEGGGHVAIRTGAIAGELAANGRLDRYNHEWKRAIGSEVLRNVAMAELVRDFGPADWDRAFRIASRLQALGGEGGITVRRGLSAAGWAGLKLAAGYRWRKYRYRDGRYVQIGEDEYGV